MEYTVCPYWDLLKILVVGIGVQGSVIATELLKNSEVSEVRLVDIDLKKTERLAERLKSESIHAGC